MRIVWTDPALDAIARAYDYIYPFNPRAAAHMAEALRAAGARGARGSALQQTRP
jgi:plasmid stabilization system protein ParE